MHKTDIYIVLLPVSMSVLTWRFFLVCSAMGGGGGGAMEVDDGYIFMQGHWLETVVFG